MITLDHAMEVALLLLVTYLAGCALGYALHLGWLAFSSRPRFEARIEAQVAAAVQHEATADAVAMPARKSAARRLAGAVEREAAPAAPPQVLPAQQRPPDLPAPRGGRADDLKQIKGIGAKTESALNDLGIYHLDQIAAWSAAHVDWLEGRIAVKGRIRREQWVEQAVLLLTATAPA